MGDLKSRILHHLQQFAGGALRENALALFDALGYRSEIQMRLEPNTAEHFLEVYDAYNIFDQKRRMRALCAEWKSVDLLFQLTEAEITEQHALFQVNAFDPNEYQSYLFFAIELQGDVYPRGALAAITREINRLFLMPALILFKHGATLTFAIINRRLHKLDSSKDVLEKVTLIKDIRSAAPHRAHIEILHDLSCAELLRKHKVMNFLELHRAWQATLDIAELNKRFFRELADWYFWAKDYVQFPEDVEPDQEIRNAKNLIRLLTRIMFIWFIKEKSLVPETLFDRRALPQILKNFLRDEQSSTYYQAILQNLFFATLNQQMDKRAFAREGAFEAHKQEYGVKTLLRYADQFAIPKEEALALFADIPFLNGGLFDCLDKENERGRVVYVDGFSRNPRKRAQVPDFLFFMPQEREVDLSAAYDPSSKKPLLRKVKGLFDLLNSYKFTVAENTPVEEEIALDPELLGKVFENLLASYNPETRTTARKQTGSFYTPREIVNYMVDESLIAYLLNTGAQASLSDRPQRPLSQSDGHNGHNGHNGRGGWEDALRRLLSYSEEPHGFSEEEVRQLIQAVNRCKILDPACGSGAFPLGALHKLVHLLHKLDPDNRLWKQEQKERVIGEKIAELKQDQALAERLSDEKVREQAIQAIQDRLQEIEAVFDREHQFDDYARKLYLIENCIYGVDIQPIAVQIAKLRCFISLIIDQKPRPEAENLGLRALPNLETKFVAANTLISLSQQIPLKTLEIVALEKELRDVRNHYFSATIRRDKLMYQGRDRQLQQEIARKLASLGFPRNEADMLSAFDPYDQSSHTDFFDPEWMFGIQEGFDVVLGNPPYVQLQSNSGQLAKVYKDQHFETFILTGDIYCLFYEKANQLLKPGGVTCYITSNKWMRAVYGEKLRKYFAQKTQPLKLIDVGPGIFEAATVDTNIFLFAKNKAAESFSGCKLAQKIESSLAEFVQQCSVKISVKPNGEKWEISSPLQQVLTQKIEQRGTPLKEWNIQIYRGVLTGYNTAFIIDGAKKDELIAADPNSADIIKPLLRGRDIQPYKNEFADSWLIFVPWHFPLNNDTSIQGASQKAEQEFEKRFPAIYKYLLQHKKGLSTRNKAETGIRYEWYALQRCAATYQAEFEKEKIVWKRIGSIMRFSYDDSGAYCLDSTCIATGEHIKFLVGVLNSTVCLHELVRISPKTGTGDQLISVQALEPLRVPKPDAAQEQAITALVDRILAAKQQNPAADTRALEAEIDRRVYALYGLTAEEIAIVEGKA